MNEKTKMWWSIAFLLFVVSIGVVLKMMEVPSYGIELMKDLFKLK